MKKSIILGVVSFMLLWWWLGSTTSTVSSQQSTARAEPWLAQETFSIPVSGTVTAVEEVKILSRTAGTISTLRVSVGSQVEQGYILGGSTNPVTIARYSTQAIASALRVLGQQSASTQVALEQSLAVNLSQEQLQLSEQTDIEDQQRRAEQERSLALWVQTVRTELPAAMRFIKDNATLLTSESNQLYRKVLQEAYGVSPSYLQASTLLTGGSLDGLFAQLQRTVSSSEQAALLPGLIELLEQTEEVLLKSERQFYGTDEIATETFAGYTATMQQLQSLRQSADSLTASVAVLAGAQTVGQIGRDAALGRATLTASTTDALLQLSQEQLVYIERLADAEIAQAAAELSLGVVTAPFAGVITKRHVSPGAYVQPGTPLFTLVGTDARELTVTLPALAARHITPGAAFIVDGAEVGEVRAVVAVQSGNSMQVVITLTGEYPVGTTVSGEITLALSDTSSLQAVSRNDITFSIQGPVLKGADGDTVPVTVVYDAGQTLLVYKSVTESGAINTIE